MTNHLKTELTKVFPDAEFFPPCTEEEIAEAEQLLRKSMPAELRKMYLCSNGIVSNRDYRLYPLLPRHGDLSLVDFTLFVWDNPDNHIPETRNIIFFGVARGGNDLGYKVSHPPGIVEFNPVVGETEIFAESVMEAYRKGEEWAKNIKKENEQ